MRDPICTTNLTKQQDRYLVTQECFMDYRESDKNRDCDNDNKLVLAHEFRINEGEKRQITVISNNIQEICRSRSRDRFGLQFQTVMRQRYNLISHIMHIRI